jgi:flagellar M-ring protein FliF
METIKTILDQSLVIWKESTGAGRVGIILLLLIAVGAVVGVGIWSSMPDYVTLAADLDQDKSSKLIAGLDQENISFRVKGARYVQVDKRQLERAYVIAKRVGVDGNELQLESIYPWMDAETQKNTTNRNREVSLAQSLKRFKAVESATVLLGIPEKQPFMRSSTPPTASVNLKLNPKHPFSDSNAASIAQTVAAAVPGLLPEQVVITDTQGNTYSFDETLIKQSKQEQFRIAREQENRTKILAILDPRFGPGNSEVQVSMGFKYPDSTITSLELDSINKVSIEELNESTTATGESPNTGGTATSSGSSAAKGSPKKSGSKTDSKSSKFRVPEIHKVEVDNTPVIESMSIAVIINTGNEKEKIELPDEKKEAIAEAIKSSVNFNEDLGGSFSLVFDSFEAPPLLEQVPQSTFPWEQLFSALKMLSLGIAAVVALFFGLKTLKSFQPATTTPDVSKMLSSDRKTQVMELSELVKQNPEVFSKIVASWANEKQPAANKSDKKAA